MTHVVTEACIRRKYTDCVSMCPVEAHPARPDADEWAKLTDKRKWLETSAGAADAVAGLPATAPWHARRPPALACRYTARPRIREAKGDRSWPSTLPSRR